MEVCTSSCLRASDMKFCGGWGGLQGHASTCTQLIGSKHVGSILKYDSTDLPKKFINFEDGVCV